MVSEITFGLRGPTGAVMFLVGVYGVLGLLVGGYWFASSVMSARQIVDRFTLALPVVGRCQRAFAIAHFSWAFYLAQETLRCVDGRALELDLWEWQWSSTDCDSVFCKSVKVASW